MSAAKGQRHVKRSGPLSGLYCKKCLDPWQRTNVAQKGVSSRAVQHNYVHHSGLVLRRPQRDLPGRTSCRVKRPTRQHARSHKLFVCRSVRLASTDATATAFQHPTSSCSLLFQRCRTSDNGLLANEPTQKQASNQPASSPTSTSREQYNNVGGSLADTSSFFGGGPPLSGATNTFSGSVPLVRRSESSVQRYVDAHKEITVEARVSQLCKGL